MAVELEGRRVEQVMDKPGRFELLPEEGTGWRGRRAQQTEEKTCVGLAAGE